MARVELMVPFEEKDVAKALGARWDAAVKRWYVPEGVDAAPFHRWLPQEANVRAARFGVAVSHESCWKCRVVTSVACLVVGLNHEKLDISKSDESEFWASQDYASSLNTVTFISPAALTAALSVAPWLRMAYSHSINGCYLANTCMYCDALQGDFFLHCEPGGAFCPVDEHQEAKITIHWFDVPLLAFAEGLGIDTEWVYGPVLEKKGVSRFLKIMIRAS